MNFGSIKGFSCPVPPYICNWWNIKLQFNSREIIKSHAWSVDQETACLLSMYIIFNSIL